MLVMEMKPCTPGPELLGLSLCVYIYQSAVYFGHMVDHMTRSKVSLHEHNGYVESMMIRTRKHTNMIL